MYLNMERNGNTQTLITNLAVLVGSELAGLYMIKSVLPASKTDKVYVIKVLRF